MLQGNPPRAADAKEHVMEKELFDYTAQKVEELLAAGSSSQSTREA